MRPWKSSEGSEPSVPPQVRGLSAQGLGPFTASHGQPGSHEETASLRDKTGISHDRNTSGDPGLGRWAPQPEMPDGINTLSSMRPSPCIHCDPKYLMSRAAESPALGPSPPSPLHPVQGHVPHCPPTRMEVGLQSQSSALSSCLICGWQARLGSLPTGPTGGAKSLRDQLRSGSTPASGTWRRGGADSL